MRAFVKQSNFSLRVVMPACHIDHLIETQQGNSGSSLIQCHLALCTTVSLSPPLSLGACQFQLASFNFHWFRSLGSTFHLSTRFYNFTMFTFTCFTHFRLRPCLVYLKPNSFREVHTVDIVGSYRLLLWENGFHATKFLLVESCWILIFGAYISKDINPTYINLPALHLWPSYLCR